MTNIEVSDIEGKEDKEGKVRERLKREFCWSSSPGRRRRCHRQVNFSLSRYYQTLKFLYLDLTGFAGN
jgi:hypothetical protein